MKNILKKLAVLLAVPLFMGQAEFSDYTTLINQKMETEQRLETHLSGIVERIVGEGKSSVIVSVELADLEKSRTQTEQWSEEREEDQPYSPEVEEYLPGVPLRRQQLEEQPEDQDAERGTGGAKRIEDVITLPSEFLASIQVSLILDRGIPDETVLTIENVLTDVLDINPARGDRLTIQRVDFAGRTIDFVGFLFNPYFYVIVLGLITLGIIGLFLFGPLRKFLFATLQTLKDLKKMKSETEFTGATAGGGGIGAGMGAGETEMEMEEELEEEFDEEKPEEEIEDGEYIEGETQEETEEEEFEKMTYKPLKFLENKDLKKLAYLLNFEKPSVAALLIDYLDAPKAAKVLAALPEENKAEIAKKIVSMQCTSKEIMEHVDEFLSQKIEYVSGGADKLVGMLEVMGETERDQILESISREDPEFSQKVESQIFSFEDIMNLDDAAIQMIIQEVETKDLGVALKNTSEEFRERFMENMSEGAAALLKEEIEYGRNVTGEQIKNSQRGIVAKIKELEADGTITGVTGEGTAELWEEELGEEEKESVLENIINAAKEAIEEKENMESPPKEETNNDEIAFKFYEKGLEAYKNENYSQAVQQFQQSLQYNPDIWQTHQYMGSCYLAMGEESKAKASYKKSLQLNPDNQELKEWVEVH